MEARLSNESHSIQLESSFIYTATVTINVVPRLSIFTVHVEDVTFQLMLLGTSEHFTCVAIKVDKQMVFVWRKNSAQDGRSQINATSRLRLGVSGVLWAFCPFVCPYAKAGVEGRGPERQRHDRRCPVE